MSEVQLKAWVVDEAAREGVSESAIHNRLMRGKYPGVVLRRENSRVVWVQLNGGSPMHQPVETRKTDRKPSKTGPKIVAKKTCKSGVIWLN